MIILLNKYTNKIERHLSILQETYRVDKKIGTIFVRLNFTKTLDISQGSAATHLMYGDIFSDSIITNYLLILTGK